MKYIDKNTLSKIERMKKRMLKKSMDKMKEMALRNSKDPNSGLNTRIQKSGMGEISNSHKKRVGSILNSNAADKAVENIDKMNDPDKRRELVKKKIEKIKKENIHMNESVTKELQKDEKLWKTTLSLWSTLCKNNKVEIQDEGLFLLFQHFIKSFTDKHKKTPSYKDALMFANTN